MHFFKISTSPEKCINDLYAWTCAFIYVPISRAVLISHSAANYRHVEKPVNGYNGFSDNSMYVSIFTRPPPRLSLSLYLSIYLCLCIYLSISLFLYLHVYVTLRVWARTFATSHRIRDCKYSIIASRKCFYFFSPRRNLACIIYAVNNTAAIGDQ